MHTQILVEYLIFFMYLNPITTEGGGTKCPRRRLFDAVLSVGEIQS